MEIPSLPRPDERSSNTHPTSARQLRLWLSSSCSLDRGPAPQAAADPTRAPSLHVAPRPGGPQGMSMGISIPRTLAQSPAPPWIHGGRNCKAGVQEPTQSHTAHTQICESVLYHHGISPKQPVRVSCQPSPFWTSTLLPSVTAKLNPVYVQDHRQCPSGTYAPCPVAAGHSPVYLPIPRNPFSWAVMLRAPRPSTQHRTRPSRSAKGLLRNRRDSTGDISICLHHRSKSDREAASALL